MKFLSVIIVTTASIVMLAVLFIYPSSGIAQQSTQLELVKVENSLSPLEFELDGVVEAMQQATLSAEVSGRVESINFDVGDFVKKGDIIVKIRAQEYRARLEKAKAELNRARAGLNESQLEFKRIEGLYKRKLVSESDFDRTSANLNVKQAGLAAARAGIAEIQEQLDNTTIEAPYSGVVLQRHIELGETVQAGQAIMSGFAQGKLRVNVHVPQSLISAVRRERSARVVLLDNGLSIAAKNMVIFPYANPASHSFQVRLNLTETDQALFPGMLVKAAFVTGQTHRLLIARQAVVYRSEVVGVYVMEDNQNITFRQVRPGHIFDGKIEILAGLEENEQVALNPVRAGVRLKQQLETR